MQEEKWRVINYFHELLERPEYERKPLAGIDTALYEVMFKFQPKKYITRPHFLTVMRLVSPPLRPAWSWCSSERVVGM
jgi:hypothetical protein